MNLSKEQIQTIKDMLESLGVFNTPLERLKNWNEFKEDAFDRVKIVKEIFNLND